MAKTDLRKKKRALFRISSPEERAELTVREFEQIEDRMEALQTLIAEGGSAKEIRAALTLLAQEMSKLRAIHKQTFDAFGTLFKEQATEYLKGISGLQDILKKRNISSEINAHAGPLYKTMINHLSGMESAFKAWKYPQYASVSVRNKSFSNIDPAQNDQAGTVGTGTLTVTTAGTAVQLSATSIPCYAVYIQCHESNVGAIAVGDSNVKAALSGRRGIALYPTNFQKFIVSNLNLLYVDAVNSGDKAHWYYEAA